MAYYDADFESGPWPPPARKPSVGRAVLTAVLVVIVLGGLGVTAWLFWQEHAGGTSPVAQLVQARGNLKDEQARSEAVYKGATPSVVHVTRLTARRDFQLNLQAIPEGTGSGFVWDEHGHVVTNYHVIGDASFAITVALADQSTWSARVVAGFADKDIAVLHIDAPKAKLHPIALGTSQDLKVGQAAYALGNPFGLDHSLTAGVISALGREIQTENGHVIKGAIQTSAAINPGNSGGPLLDSAGRLIGITTAILSPSGGWSGVGFAIPADEVNRVVSEAIAHPAAPRAALGITFNQELQQKLLGKADGVLVLNVLKGGAAEKAGLRPTRGDDRGIPEAGDLIVAVGKDRIRTAKDLQRALARHKVGDEVSITVMRDGQDQTVTVKLQAASR
jgi:S1-C subfamily serine protease